MCHYLNVHFQGQRVKSSLSSKGNAAIPQFLHIFKYNTSRLVKPRRQGFKPLPLEVKRRKKGSRIYSRSYIFLGFDLWTLLTEPYKINPHGKKLGVGVCHYFLPRRSIHLRGKYMSRHTDSGGEKCGGAPLAYGAVFQNSPTEKHKKMQNSQAFRLVDTATYHYVFILHHLVEFLRVHLRIRIDHYL